MKRITCLVLFTIYLFSCGGGGQTVQDVSPQEEKIARSLVVQEGERPKIDPGVLNPKVPPQKIISSAKAAPNVAAPKEIKPVKSPEPIEKDTVAVVAAEEKVVPKDTFAVVSELSAETSEELEEVVAPVADIVEESEPLESSGISERFPLRNIAFDDIYFDNKSQLPSSTFNSNYYVTLGKIVKALRSDPEVKVRISGYTDFEGSEQYNYDLSEKRALTFAKILLDLFPADMQADIAQRIEINPKGSSDLLVNSKNKARRALNRRVSFELFFGDLQNNPYSVYIHSVAAATPTVRKSSTGSSVSSHSIQQKLYDKAMMLFNQKRYSEAIDIFGEIITIDAKHSLVDNAYFWIGEALYYQGRYSEALEKYRQVFTSGDGNKGAAAQMRLGYCYFRLNQLDQAVVEFRKVISNYPNASEEIRRSKMVLSKIKNY